MVRRFIAILLFSLKIYTGFSQNFVDVTNEWGVAALNASTMYGTGSSAYDINEDGWDDLTICIAGAPTRLYINHQGSFQLHTTFENIYDSKTCLWGDYDEDGDNDLFIIKRDGASQLFVQTDSLVFVNQSNLLNFPFSAANNSFGAALGDYNRDSYLDLYIANYSTAAVGGIKSTFFTNNQNGGFSSTPHGYYRNHFQPAFIDLARDKYQDLFIINDFRTGSELYTQDSNGSFTDLTNNGALGLSGMVYLDAMTNSWCDYDNDSDLDLYVANTPNYGNFLFQNNGQNSFSNVASAAGASLNKWSWSSLWFDLENDGWNDLIVCERHINLLYLSQFGNHVLRNNQGNFTLDVSTGISNLPYGYFTSSKGDFNNDGLYDLYLGAETAQQSRLFQNATTTSNNYVKCRLNGRFSNRNGVGTFIDYYVGGLHRVHYTQLGENYLCQNSQNYIFGLGENTQIDSLKLSWISGIVDTYYNIPANTTHVFIEGETMPQIQASKAYLCSSVNDSLQLSISGWPIHTWSNGSSQNSIWVNTPGVYSVTVGTGFGHTIILNYSVSIVPVENVVIERNQVLCNGGNSGSIQVTDGSTGAVMFSQANLTAGVYSVPLTFSEGCVVYQEVVIDEPLPFQLVVDSLKNSCVNFANGSALVIANGGTPPFTGYNDFGYLNLNNLSAGNYSGIITDANGCEASYSFNITEIPHAQVQINSSEFVCPNETVVFDATVSGIGNYYFWDVLAPGALLGPGDYLTAVIDSFGCITPVGFSIQESLSPSISAAIIHESILGLGSISIDVNGNFGPYSAVWQSGTNGYVLNGLQQGIYAVSIFDNNGCLTDTAFTLLFDFVETDEVSNGFVFDSKSRSLKHLGSIPVFNVKLFNESGQLILERESIASNESIELNGNIGLLFVSTSNQLKPSRVRMVQP